MEEGESMRGPEEAAAALVVEPCQGYIDMVCDTELSVRLAGYNKEDKK